MNKSKRILKVPQESFLRNRLRKESRILVQSKKLLPPARFETLEKLAVQLLNKLEISKDYIDFAIVLIGNETWRETVKATPINRRLLLLPQCLKNNVTCKGVFDELGLNCAGCKGCLIDDILIAAEKMGYATLVAEGTTVAVGLVEEGAIDAVIGVSCMPVLQRSFEPVSNAAVPVIGLPLMYDGCDSTKIDSKWLLDEIKSFEENADLKPLSVSLLKSRIQKYFSEESAKLFFPESGESEQLAKEYLLIGGQRMRPLMSVLSYLAYSKKNSETILSSLSMIIECFHKASLVHDDIQDNADLRYNTKTAHKKHGIPVAINIGDYLIGKGYQILSNLPVDDGLIAKCLKKITLSHVKLTQGQGADILLYSQKNELNTEKAFHIFKLKTGEALKVALLLGAILGGAEENEVKILEQFSDWFGIAYQIRDDLNEFQENNREEKINDFPFLIALLNEYYSEKNNILSEKALSDIGEFRKQIVAGNLILKAENILNEYVDKCYSQLDELQNAKLRLSLYGVIGKIFKPINANE
ncbi:MAG: polyprenyl synthetase family protein [Bacteroidetes bacterium]|nr:polyprenyl synthetase family protein [Bacteroidota bacterium]